jgi:hypothetical protein
MLNKAICLQCCKEARATMLIASWSEQVFNEDWGRGVLWCVEQGNWICLNKDFHDFWDKSKKRKTKNARLIRACPYLLEHIVNG